MTILVFKSFLPEIPAECFPPLGRQRWQSRRGCRVRSQGTLWDCAGWFGARRPPAAGSSCWRSCCRRGWRRISTPPPSCVAGAGLRVTRLFISKVCSEKWWRPRVERCKFWGTFRSTPREMEKKKCLRATFNNQRAEIFIILFSGILTLNNHYNIESLISSLAFWKGEITTQENWAFKCEIHFNIFFVSFESEICKHPCHIAWIYSTDIAQDRFVSKSHQTPRSKICTAKSVYKELHREKNQHHCGKKRRNCILIDKHTERENRSSIYMHKLSVKHQRAASAVVQQPANMD